MHRRGRALRPSTLTERNDFGTLEAQPRGEATVREERNHARARRGQASLVVVVASLIWTLAATAQAQPADPIARLHIVNAGINLGWVNGILETEGGLTAANQPEIATDLANASAAITALIIQGTTLTDTDPGLVSLKVFRLQEVHIVSGNHRKAKSTGQLNTQVQAVFVSWTTGAL